MRTKTLLFLSLLTFGALNAQDTIRTLVISEARLDDARHGYAELTNVGTDTINLAEFEFGIIGAWTPVSAAWVFSPGVNYYVMLPDRKLAPGKSFIIAGVYDWGPENYLKNPELYTRILNKKEFWTLADMKCDFPESPTGAASDSITPFYHIMEVWSGRDCFYVRHHVSATDSVVVDQVNGVFASATNTRIDGGAMDVAGMIDATNLATLVRKFSVKQGNIDFETGRGQTLDESEWMPIPLQLGHWEMDRKLFWTAGNHGDYNLDAETLIPASSDVEIDWTNEVITVPWGVRKDDSVMMQFVKKPGLAWHYDYVASYPDSAFTSARTGDTLTVYACGNELDMIKFAIVVAEPTEDAAVVMPVRAPNQNGFYAGQGGAYAVSDGIPGMDTISSSAMIGFGITFGTRADTLQKYLEKAANATWEFVWVDGNERTDLKNGDILKVTSANSTVKNYFIKVNEYRKAHNAYLSAITWPDIPEAYRGVFGWMGDTVPSFSNTVYNYIVQVPADVVGIPALVAKSEDVNATIAVERAINLYGSPADKTVTFTVTAVDDSTVREYGVQLEKEKDPNDIQPYKGEPFFSQWVWNEQWANNYIEAVNPGNQTLDLSNYMFCWGSTNSPADAISRLGNNTTADWTNRYQKYIPGYKWQDSTSWKVEAAMTVQDLNVNNIVQPGDVFVMGQSNGINQATEVYGSYANWFVAKQLDVDFNANRNPWGEPIGNWNALNQWNQANYYLFRIENDSVLAGTKAATDPNDFTLIDVIGSGDGTVPVIGGLQLQQINGYVRKPHIYLGNTAFKGSFGTDQETSEWIFTDRAYYDARNVGWPQDILYVAQGLGSHFMNEVTIYKSTVSSLVYKVSQGYGKLHDELIKGAVTGTTVTDFLANIMVADTGQTLELKSGTTSNILVGDSVLMNNDTLIVVSADMQNTTKYVLEVSDEGLSGNAVLTSTLLTIGVTGETGTISGFTYGTKLKSIRDNVTVPDGAEINIIDANDAYVPFTMLNFDTLYVDVLVNDQIRFEVIAEDGVTKIVYQLQPTSTSTDAFVTSSVFAVGDIIIDLIPGGISPYGLLSNLIPAKGATMQLIDKLGYERLFGSVVKDDQLVVTAEDGETTRTYFLKFLDDTDIQFAYVVSDVYAVDQVMFTITGATDATLVTAFLADLLPAEGATVIITDSEGVEKTSGKLRPGDLVVVTASDGVTTNTYLIDVVLSVNNSINDKINVYPNPSRGLFTVSGMEVGNRIQVTNILGMRVYEKFAVAEKEPVSLEGQRNGVYFITISNGKDVVGRYKVVKE
jgi:hypothetical protein